ncbi:ATP phosphoribosyltransferase [Corticicoccus populi]|uniref:ATP phosphoribosyltransferase n=1 Tax=Corticicoccus populi TaxID=1812821 RepID=A0ABW5WVF7_9STAP
MITVALTKGRLFKDFIRYLKNRDLQKYISVLENDSRTLYTEVDNVRFIFAKGPDVPTYVELGAADIGIVGSDILAEDSFNVLNVSQLPFGDCHFSIAGPPDVERFNTVASKYTNIARTFFNEKKQPVQLIHLNGSVELAPLLDLADGIVDIVQTGSTLRDNGLIEYEKILDVHARLIANKRTFYTKEDGIYQFLTEIGVMG